MEQSEREELKQYLLEMDPCLELDSENEDKLIGYAERFGCHIIPLYEGINTFFVSDPEEAEKQANEISSMPMFPMPQMNVGIIGYVTFDDKAALLYDKEKYLDKLAKEYEEDETFEIDEDETYYFHALDWFCYNDIGYGSSSEVTPAFACTEEWEINIPTPSEL